MEIGWLLSSGMGTFVRAALIGGAGTIAGIVAAAAGPSPSSGHPIAGRIAFDRVDAPAGAEGAYLGTFVAAADGSDEVRIRVPLQVDLMLPGWSPDGTRLVVNGFGPPPRHTLPALIDADGNGYQRLAVVTDLDIGCSDWSPDGATLLCWAARADHPEVDGIYTVNIDGTHLTRLTVSPFHDTVGTAGECGGGQGRGVYSPDGAQVVFIEQRCGHGPDPSSDESAAIERIGSDGSGVVEIMPQGLVMSHPGSQLSWSPDGALIAFTSQDGRLQTVRPDGSGLTQVPIEGGWNGRFATGADWSPDGSRIAFSLYQESEGSTDVYTVEPDGSGLTRLTDAPGAETGVRWAPSNGG